MDLYDELKTTIAKICESKRGRIDPALATELELKQALSRRGVNYTADTFRAMLRELEADDEIITRRCLRYNGYQMREKYAYNAETNEDGISTPKT